MSEIIVNDLLWLQMKFYYIMQLLYYFMHLLILPYFNNTRNNENDIYFGTELMWPSKLLKKLGMNMFEIENSL